MSQKDNLEKHKRFRCGKFTCLTCKFFSKIKEAKNA